MLKTTRLLPTMSALGKLAFTCIGVAQSACRTVRYQLSSGSSAFGWLSQNFRSVRLAMMRTVDSCDPNMGSII